MTSYPFVLISVIFAIGASFFVPAFSAEPSSNKYICSEMSSDTLQCSAGSNQFTAHLQAPVSSAVTTVNAPLSRLKLVSLISDSDFAAYSVTVSGEGEWCMAFKGTGSPLKAKPLVALLSGVSGSLAVLPDYSDHIKSDVGSASIQLCHDSAGRNKAEQIFSLVIGTDQKVTNALIDPPAAILPVAARLPVFGKTSSVVKDSYLFVDLTAKNANDVLGFATAGHFPYVLTYATTWTTGYGSYQVNTMNFPDGVKSLSDVSRMAESRGIKLGLHTLTGLISKNDPMISSGSPERRLLMSGQATLLKPLSALANEFVTSPITASATKNSLSLPSVGAAVDLLIDNEIVRCILSGSASEVAFTQCSRGINHTVSAVHMQSAVVQTLGERFGAYLADLRTPLKGQIADRIAGVVNQVNPGMIYFDGGEVSAANGDPDYYVAEEQIQVLQRVKNKLLVEGSGLVPRLWPYLTRVVTDDFAALAPIEYLDSHKIGYIYPRLRENLMPAQLGWIGLLPTTPSYPQTTVEDVSTYMARALSLDLAFSIETTYSSLHQNSYTQKLLAAFSVANKALQSGTLSDKARQNLALDFWYFQGGDVPHLSRLNIHPIVHVGTETLSTKSVPLSQDTNAVMVRLNNVVKLGTSESNGLVDLLQQGAVTSVKVTESKVDAGNRGQQLTSLSFAKKQTASGENAWIDFNAQGNSEHALNLTHARRMLVEYDTDTKNGDVCSVLNLQLQDSNGLYRDYFLDIQPGSGRSTVLYYEDAPLRMMRELTPSSSAYAMKSALYTFDFASITAVNIRLMKSCSAGRTITIKKLQMLGELPATLHNVGISVGGLTLLTVPALNTDQVLDIFPDGTATICKAGDCTSLSMNKLLPGQLPGKLIQVSSDGDASFDLKIGELGQQIPIEIK